MRLLAWFASRGRRLRSIENQRGHLLGALILLSTSTLASPSDAALPMASRIAFQPGHGEAAPAITFPPAIEPLISWPVFGPVTSFMDSDHPLGIDVGLAHSPIAPIRAAMAGTVTFAGGRYCCSYGYHVVVQHRDGLSTLYAHLSEVLVAEGDAVGRGQVLGLGGASGYSEGGAHLHFEFRHDEDLINPLDFLPRYGAPEDD